MRSGGGHDGLFLVLEPTGCLIDAAQITCRVCARAPVKGFSHNPAPPPTPPPPTTTAAARSSSGRGSPSTAAAAMCLRAAAVKALSRPPATMCSPPPPTHMSIACGVTQQLRASGVIQRPATAAAQSCKGFAARSSSPPPALPPPTPHYNRDL